MGASGLMLARLMMVCGLPMMMRGGLMMRRSLMVCLRSWVAILVALPACRNVLLVSSALRPGRLCLCHVHCLLL
jgi:hypothetical protein